MSGGMLLWSLRYIFSFMACRFSRFFVDQRRFLGSRMRSGVNRGAEICGSCFFNYEYNLGYFIQGKFYNIKKIKNTSCIELINDQANKS